MSQSILFRCDRCNWKSDNNAYWECDCHYVWDVFANWGHCPVCKKVWTYIQCPSCAFPTPLEEWYNLSADKHPVIMKKRKKPSGQPEFLHVFLGEKRKEKTLHEHIRVNALWWIMSRKQYLLKRPAANRIWFELCRNEPVLIECIEQGMHQIHKNMGFEIDKPLFDLDVPGFNRLMDILLVDRVNRYAHHEFIQEGFIIDEFEIRGDTDEIVKIYNKVLVVSGIQ